jgi:hypothetical protein
VQGPGEVLRHVAGAGVAPVDHASERVVAGEEAPGSEVAVDHDVGRGAGEPPEQGPRRGPGGRRQERDDVVGEPVQCGQAPPHRRSSPGGLCRRPRRRAPRAAPGGTPPARARARPPGARVDHPRSARAARPVDPRQPPLVPARAAAAGAPATATAASRSASTAPCPSAGRCARSTGRRRSPRCCPTHRGSPLAPPRQRHLPGTEREVGWFGRADHDDVVLGARRAGPAAGQRSGGHPRGGSAAARPRGVAFTLEPAELPSSSATPV